MDYEYLDYALEDAIVALNFVQDMEEPLGVCFADIGRSIATIEELRERLNEAGVCDHDIEIVLKHIREMEGDGGENHEK